MPEDGAAMPVLHPIDQGRRDLLAAIHQHAIGGCQPEQRCLAGAKRHRQQRRQILVQAEFAGIVANLVHTQIHRQARRHQIARLLDTDPHDRRPVKPSCVVGRLPFRLAGPLVDNKRRVEDTGRRVVALIKRGEIDKGLEGRSGLAKRLHGAVEFGIQMIVAAAHRQQPPGMRVKRDDRPLDSRPLRQRVIAGARLKPVADQVGRILRVLHHDDVTNRQRVPKIGQRLRPHATLVTRRIGPEGKLERDPAAHAVHVNLRLALCYLGHIGGVMAGQHGLLVLCQNGVKIAAAGMTCQCTAPSLTPVQ